MRTIASLLFLFAATTGCASGIPTMPAATATLETTGSDVADDDSEPRALTAFRDALDGFGAWEEEGDYGTVWTPSDATFVPYVSDGHWANLGLEDNSDAVWLSDTTWGAVTTHRGRWVATPSVNGSNRWHWIPGMRLAGSWTTWKHAGSELAWAPTPPTTTWRHGVAHSVSARPSPIVETTTNGEFHAHAAHPDFALASADMAIRQRIATEQHTLSDAHFASGSHFDNHSHFDNGSHFASGSHFGGHAASSTGSHASLGGGHGHSGHGGGH